MKMPMLQKSVENLLRNWMTTVPTILAMAIVLTMFHGLLVVNDRAAASLDNMQRKFSITVYLKDDADPFEIGNLIARLETQPDVVKPVTFTSKEQAWQTMSRTFSLDDNLLKKYRFSLPASLTITPKKLEDARRIEKYLDATAAQLLADPLTTKDKQKEVMNQMVGFIQNVRNSTLKNLLLFTVLFVIGGTLLLSSAIHLAISSRRLEINIMKLVGASYGSITAPFVVEGVILGILAFLANVFFLIVIPSDAPIRAFPNALLLEFVAVVVFAAAVSYATSWLHIRKS